MERRTFLALVPGCLLAAPLVAEAQQVGKIRRVGVLSVGAAPSAEEIARSPFLAALRDLGWIMGQNIVFEPRHAAGQSDRLPALAAELVGLKVDVIVTLLNQETLAAKQATTSIPIVMLLGVYPVQAGLVASLARPGGNVTGTTVAPLTGGKYLELLKEAIPKLTRVAILWDPTFPGLTDAAAQAQMEVEARTLGLTLASIEIHRLDDVDRALVRIAKEPPGALLVVPGGPLPARAGQVIDFASRHGWPTIFPAREYVEAGGLMSYGYDREHLWNAPLRMLTASWGAKPGDLPVEQPTKFELVINLKTAKAIGLTIPPSVLARADQVIE
jgi:putative ABC transport system substrate-binding protein